MCFYNFLKNTTLLKLIAFVFLILNIIFAFLFETNNDIFIKLFLNFLNFSSIFFVTYLLKQLSTKQPLIFVLWIIFEQFFIILSLYYPMFLYIFNLLFDIDTKLTRPKNFLNNVFYFNETKQTNLNNYITKTEKKIYKNNLFYDYSLTQDNLINLIGKILKLIVAIFFINCNLWLLKKYYCNIALQNDKLVLFLTPIVSIFYFLLTIIYFLILNVVLNFFGYYSFIGWIFNIFYTLLLFYYYLQLFFCLNSNFDFNFKYPCFRTIVRDEQKNQQETLVFSSMFDFPIHSNPTDLENSSSTTHPVNNETERSNPTDPENSSSTNHSVNNETERSNSTNSTNPNSNKNTDLSIFYWKCFLSSFTSIIVFVMFELICFNLSF